MIHIDSQSLCSPRAPACLLLCKHSAASSLALRCAHRANGDSNPSLALQGKSGRDRNSPARLCLGQAGCRLHRRSAEGVSLSLAHGHPSPRLLPVQLPATAACVAVRTGPKFSPSNVTQFPVEFPG